MSLALAVFFALVVVFGGLGLYVVHEVVIKPKRRAEMLEQRKKDLDDLNL